MSSSLTPQQAWGLLKAGNQRFVDGTVDHPHQDAGWRAALAESQSPHAVIFGCSDSRLAAEIIFDVGLGDVFVIRTAGQVIDDAVLGSLQFAIEEIHVPLIIVLGQDRKSTRLNSSHVASSYAVLCLIKKTQSHTA